MQLIQNIGGADANILNKEYRYKETIHDAHLTKRFWEYAKK